jgi:ABC-type nickel/cobalt efflux system permease component RcnA
MAKKDTKALFMYISLFIIGISAFFIWKIRETQKTIQENFYHDSDEEHEHFEDIDETGDVDRRIKCSKFNEIADGLGVTGRKIWCSGGGGFCNTCPVSHKEERSGSGNFYYGIANNKDESTECKYLNDKKLWDERCGTTGDI